jgi:hypothetical protein
MVCAWTPWLASTRRSAPWQAAKERETSHEKSTWPYSESMNIIIMCLEKGKKTDWRVDEVQHIVFAMKRVYHAEKK